MTKNIDLFVWHTPGGGFQWKDTSPLTPDNQRGLSEADRAETRFLVPKPMETPGHRRYNPLVMYPTLYKEFAELQPTEKAFAKFASDYGDLGVGVLTEAGGLMEAHDPFCRWRAAHALIRPVADVLSAIQSEDIPALQQWFVIANNGARYHRRDPDQRWGSSGWITIEGELRDYLWKWALKGESNAEILLRVARGWAQEQINEAIGGDKQPGTNSSARVVFDQDRERMTLRIVPETLIGAIWFQCARVLTLNPTFRTCNHCNKWFELSPDTRRKQSIYCSDRCKVAAYRAKKPTSKKVAR